MEKEGILQIIYDEAKRSYDLTITSIKTYDTRIHHILILTTASISILFSISGYISANILIKENDFPSFILLLISVSVLFFISSLILCLRSYNIPTIQLLEPKKVLDGYNELSNESIFLEELIHQIDDNVMQNLKILGHLWENYSKAILLLVIGWLVLGVFIISILLGNII